MVAIKPISVFLIAFGVVVLVFAKGMAENINRFQREAFWHWRGPLWLDLLGVRLVGAFSVGIGILSLFKD